MCFIMYNGPITQLSKFEGARTTLSSMVEACQGLRGEKSPLVRELAEKIIGKIYSKDYCSEILAINYWTTKNVYYTNDPLHVEYLKDPARIAEEYMKNGFSRGDCDDMACFIATLGLILGRNSELVVVGFQSNSLSHVFCRIKEPKTQKWIVCDPVAGDTVTSMLKKIKNYEIWSCDENPLNGPIMTGVL